MFSIKTASECLNYPEMTIHLHKIDKESPIHCLLRDGPNGSLIFLEAKTIEYDLCSTETYAKLLRISKLPKIDYFFTQFGPIMNALWKKQDFVQYPLKTSSKTGGTLVNNAKN